jgi:hypothetical protein
MKTLTRDQIVEAVIHAANGTPEPDMMIDRSGDVLLSLCLVHGAEADPVDSEIARDTWWEQVATRFRACATRLQRDLRRDERGRLRRDRRPNRVLRLGDADVDLRRAGVDVNGDYKIVRGRTTLEVLHWTGPAFRYPEPEEVTQARRELHERAVARAFELRGLAYEQRQETWLESAHRSFACEETPDGERRRPSVAYERCNRVLPPQPRQRARRE